MQSAENPANEFTENESEVDGFDDGNTESFSAGDDDQTQKEMQELVLNVQDGVTRAATEPMKSSIGSSGRYRRLAEFWNRSAFALHMPYRLLLV